MVSSANFKSLTEWSLGVQSFVYREKSRVERTVLFQRSGTFGGGTWELSMLIG